MKSVSDSFEAVQLQASATVVRQVYYKRRYWNATSRAYAWESSWTELTEREVLSVSPVVWNLDTDQLNEFKVSNVTVTVDNSDNKWRPDNPTGIFGLDSSSNLQPYEPYWMKFQVKAGFVLANGTTETVSVFTGVATDYTLSGSGKTCQISIQGLEALLVGTKAESIATTVTEENAGTGNGATTAFTTLNPGVGGITEVSVAGVKKLEGSDYTVSNLNSSSLGASATFTVAPPSGTIRISYFYWPQSQKFETLVAALVTAAGISGGNQSIQPVAFANSVINSFNFTTQANFDTGVKTDVDTSYDSGKILLDMSGSTMRQATTWSTSISGWSTGVSSTGTATSDGTYLVLAGGVSGGSARASRSMTKSIGCWQFKYTLNSATATLVCSMNSGVDSGPTTYFMNVGNRIELDGANSRITFVDQYSGTEAVVSHTFDTSEHTVTIAFNGLTLYIYHDGSLVLSSLVDTWTTPLYMGFQCGGISKQAKVRDIYIPADTLSGTWVSAATDSSSTPTAWGAFEYIQHVGVGTLTYQTAASADNISYDSYVTVSGSTPQSTLRRYVKIKITLSLSSSVAVGTNYVGYFGVDVPYIEDVTLRTTTTSTLVTLPVFTGDDVYSAVQKMGEYTNYEFGFTPDEVFFFRPKTPAASVLSMDQSNYISSIPSMDLGHSRVYGVVRTTYGSITKEVTDDGNAPESATARFKNLRYESSPDSNIIIPATADIATGVAQALFAYVSKPRKRFKMITHFLPQLDLSDVVTVTMTNKWPKQVWYTGDDNPNIYLGNMDLDLWGEDEQFVASMIAKIISARYDTNQRSCEFEVEEIL